MPQKNRFIPFRILPGSWGLTGKTYQIAEAEYNLTGYDLEVRKNEILVENEQQRQINYITIQEKYGKINPYDAEIAIAQIKMPDKDLDIELLNIDRKYKKLEKHEYEKKLADLKEEPWVAMPNLSWDPSDPNKSFFELDYNEYFVMFLKNNGYHGISDEQIVEKWLNDVCRSVANEMAIDDPTFVTTGVNATKRVKKGKRKTEYS